MNATTKLALRRFALRWLRKLLDLADDWLHNAEVELRNDLSPSAEKRETNAPTPAQTNAVRRSHDAGGIAQLDQQTPGSARVAAGDAQRMAKNRHHETYAEWEKRRSGVTVISKRETRRRRLSARDFDLRFAQ